MFVHCVVVRLIHKTDLLIKGLDKNSDTQIHCFLQGAGLCDTCFRTISKNNNQWRYFDFKLS